MELNDKTMMLCSHCDDSICASCGMASGYSEDLENCPCGCNGKAY